MLKVFEAFAGVGSQRMALRNLGIEHEVVGICEIDKFALKSYEAIHGDCPNFGDISKIDVNDLPNMDLFTYSFPCQDLSIAGKQKGLGEGTRSGLLYECEKIIEAKMPKYLLLENVKNLVGKKFKNDFDKWLNYLESLGYKNYWKVLNAKDYEVPQNRERVFVVSILNDNQGYEFPSAVKLTKCMKDILESEVEDKYFIDKPFKFVNKGHQAELEIKGMDIIKRVYSVDKVSPSLTTMAGGYREPKILCKKIKQYVEVRKYDVDIEALKKEIRQCKINKNITIKQISELLEVDKTTVAHWFRNDNCFSIPSKDIWMNLKKIIGIKTDKFDKSIMEFELKVNKFDQSNRVYKVEGISPTLTCKTESNIERVVYSDKEGYKVRKLTPLECWRLMGFTDNDYYKAKKTGISNSQLYKQAGNSIVVKVLEGIFESLFLYKDKAENEIKTTTVKLENKVEKYDQIKWVI